MRLMAQQRAKPRTLTEPASPLEIYVPPPPLSGLVESLWYSPGDTCPRSQELVLPTGSADLVIRLDESQAVGGGVSGPRSRPVVVGAAKTHELLGVHFKPGGAFPFLQFPLGEFLNRGLTISEIWGPRDSCRLLDVLSQAKGVNGKFRGLETLLMSLVRQDPGHHPAVSFALEALTQNPACSSLDLAGHAGYSQRRFVELFRAEVGMRPKLFCRLRRFRMVVRGLQSQSTAQWTNLALESGYFDQSHFIHDFREFSGVTPREYIGLRTPHVNHLQHPA